jgi:hypothetical protein
MEYWSNGRKQEKRNIGFTNTPSLQYSNTPIAFNSFMEVFVCFYLKSRNITEN